MTEITKDHVEWAVVDRLRRMLETPPFAAYEVTETYALFTTTLCWVMQRLGISKHPGASQADEAALHLLASLESEFICAAPWDLRISAKRPLAQVGQTVVPVPTAPDFSTHTASRFFRNLRNATAHGDARNVQPFNSKGVLLGFTFSCQERDLRTRKVTWEGEITLLQVDMQRFGAELARRYCVAIQAGVRCYAREVFEADAASITEREAA